MNIRKINLLFLCTGNSCRSQMAEGLCRHFRGERIAAYSAGIEKHGLNPLAVKVMQEIGIDISHHHSKNSDELSHISFDQVITVCGHADETCPLYSAGTQVIHQGFDDPPKLAENVKDEAEVLDIYRRVRDEIKDYILTLPDSLTAPENA